MTDAVIDALELWADFRDRFIAEMMTALPIFGDTEAELRAYAAGIAGSYYETEWQREEGPEACAQADISYWNDQ